MDSMRQLGTSLPRNGRRSEQPHELLSDFKAAALSVTKLYKSAATAQAKSRAAGYQDALDELLAFLDKEELGLMDGEGWKVRQWATLRLSEDGGDRQQASEDEQEEVTSTGKAEEEGPETRSSSPETVRKPTVPVSSSELVQDASSPHRRVVSEPAPQQAPAPTARPTAAPTAPTAPTSIPEFTFRSNHLMPTNHEREAGGMEVDGTATPAPPAEPVRISSRANRSKHPNHNRHNQNHARTVNFSLGSGAGGKRKFPYPDFFDIGDIALDTSEGRREGNGGRGGKRSRHV
jgi:hypothetical protein